MATTTVPGIHQVGLNNVGFLIDDREGRGVKRRSVPFLRNQADTGSKPGAQSLSPAGVWRSYAEDWSHGAGQSNRDRDDSDPARFRSSKGVNVWDRWKMSLLPDTVLKRATATIDNTLQVAGEYLYVDEGTEMYWTSDITVGVPVWTAANIQAGEAAATVGSVTSDGYTVWASLLSNGIHQTVRGATVSTHYNDLQNALIGYVKGRLMASVGRILYNVTAAGAAPAPLFTHPNVNFVWNGFGEGPTHIYATGYSGQRSFVYKTGIQPDGTALAIPTIAAELPEGEIVRSLFSYVGYLVIGSDLGVRLGAIGADGNITLGQLIPTPSRVLALTGQDRFVWFDYTKYDATSHGLGRLDLSTFTAPLTPAYASDLMMAPTGSGFLVYAVATFQNLRVFTVGGHGLYAQSPNKVATGTLDGGDISFGITDDKVATTLDVSHEPLLGSHGASLSVNGGAFASLGTHTEGGAEGPFTIPETRGERFEVRHTLNRKATDTPVGPTLTRSTFSSYPVPRRPSEVFEVWLRLTTNEATSNGNTASRDPRVLLDDLIALEEAGTVIDFQLGDRTYRGLIEDHDFRSEGEPFGAWPEGSVGLTIRAI